jgi:hypothetical protein
MLVSLKVSLAWEREALYAHSAAYGDVRYMFKDSRMKKCIGQIRKGSRAMLKICSVVQTALGATTQNVSLWFFWQKYT